MKPCRRGSPELAEVIDKLVDNCRERKFLIRLYNSVRHKVRSLLAIRMGYKGKDTAQAERKRIFKEADAAIDSILEAQKKGEDSGHPSHGSVVAAMAIWASARKERAKLKRKIVELAKRLPVAKWMEHPDQHGFGWESLGVIIGETGDLDGYVGDDKASGVAKVWKRMGCAPLEHNGRIMMPSSWRMLNNTKNKLPKSEWKKIGYNPWRRSLMDQVAKAIHKLNGETNGPYRRRYDEIRAAIADNPKFNHPCPNCGGGGTTKRGKECGSCDGRGMLTGHAYQHALLLMVKRLLKELTLEWQGRPPMTATQKARVRRIA